MKKIYIFFLILGFSFVGKAQDLTDWQVGFNVNPFFYNRIEKSNFLDKDKQNLPNGLGVGLTIEKNWNSHWGIKTGIDYCSQNLKYSFLYSIQYETKTTIDYNVNYFKIPLSLQYSTAIRKDLFFIANQGFQVSLLKNYSIAEYPLDAARTTALKNSTYGILGGVGLKYVLSPKFSISSLVRYEYDLTTSDNEFISVVQEYGYGISPNAKNLRIGLEFGIQYHFSFDVFFDKRGI